MISEGKDQNSDFVALREHCENAEERKAHVKKIARQSR